jgi:hypothetical protein
MNKCEACGAVFKGDVCTYCRTPLNADGPDTVIVNNYNYAPGGTDVPESAVENLVAGSSSAAQPSTRSWIVALVLCILLGYLGVHRFYAGKYGTGIIWLFTAGGFVIGWIVDIVLLAMRRFADGEGRAIER